MFSFVLATVLTLATDVHAPDPTSHASQRARTSPANSVSLQRKLDSRAVDIQILKHGRASAAVLSDLFYADVALHQDAEAIAVGARYLSDKPHDDRFRLDYAYALNRTHHVAAHAAFVYLAASHNAQIARQARGELDNAGHPSQDTLLTDGYRALQNGGRTTAIGLFERHLSKHPDDFRVLLDVAFAQDAANNHTAALASIDRYLVLRPSDTHAQLQRAYELAAVGKNDAALLVFHQLVTSPDIGIVKSAMSAIKASESAASTSDENTDYALLSASYASLQKSDNAAAITGFFRHLYAHPDDATVMLALAYAQAANHDAAGSFESLNRYLALRPDDLHASLQRAYLLDGLGLHAQAQVAYRALSASSDTDVSLAAKKQLVTFVEPSQVDGFSETWLGWDSRLGDTLYGSDENLHLAAGVVQPYAAFHLANDTRSTGGRAPVVFNDNATIGALGLRAKVLPGTYLYTEAGEFFGLLNQGNFSSLRIGLSYHGEDGQHVGSHTSLDEDVSSYSYYTGDIISYGQIRHFSPVTHHVSALFGANLGLDTHRLYYNNFLEGVGGVQVLASHVTFRFTEVYGRYVLGLSAPTEHYWTFRPSIYYDAHL